MFAIAFLFLFLTFVRAVPQSPITATSSSSLAHPTHFPTSFRHSSSHNTLHLSHSGSQSHIIPSNTRPLSFPGHSGRPRPPPPTSTPLPPRPKHKPILIAFEVIGGLALAGVLLSLIRCYYNYKRTPHRDRIADILQRHHLQRELEELERNPHLLRRPSLREPAPPYFPRPPSYDDLTSGGPLASRGVYSAVGTHSPPPSPPMSQIVLPVSTVAVRTPPNLIPPAPSG
ncbi:hypothetical protein JR316_0004890 [Psilocybe cubensis]|uniref:Transmembrane protein n=2 Tax=Psilocybe cubensis TaxID=181762 RepID=A0A8H8CL35_PSICU|nr:hypothetical protein JR316_0004890 [Psilocybe cubensis]KAH9482790.1 hypothetical protein JR316_0004890 [Psilocybe cubensis]